MTETLMQKPEYGPMNDVIFKCLFGNVGNEKITKSFLEYVIGHKIEQIATDYKLDLNRKSPKSKKMVADLIAKDEKLRKYIIEMQRKAYNYLPNRFIGYLSNVYIADIKVKEDYGKLKRTVMIIVMEEDFLNLKDIQEYHTIWNYREKKHKEKILTKSTEIHILELNKYKRQKEKTGKVEPWPEFFINPYGKEVTDMARTMEELEAAVKQLRLLNADEEVRMLADEEDFAEYDRYMQSLEEREAGREAGRAEGRAEGRKEGREEGKEEKEREIAKKMKDVGIKIELIMQMTNLTKEEIENL